MAICAKIVSTLYLQKEAMLPIAFLVVTASALGFYAGNGILYIYSGTYGLLFPRVDAIGSPRDCSMRKEFRVLYRALMHRSIMEETHMHSKAMKA